MLEKEMMPPVSGSSRKMEKFMKSDIWKAGMAGGVAVVLMLAASEPPCGSVSAKAGTILPLQIAGR